MKRDLKGVDTDIDYKVDISPGAHNVAKARGGGERKTALARHLSTCFRNDVSFEYISVMNSGSEHVTTKL